VARHSVEAMRGRLIAFEGVDGCGKTTQAELLVQRIGEPLALLTAEPGGTALGARLRQLILDPESPPVSDRAEVLLLAADRAQHVSDVLEPSLEAGRWVVSDRYSGSTLAYQGYGRGIDIEELRRLVVFATGGLRVDLNVLIDVPPEIARARATPERADRLERLDAAFHQRVREGYLELADADRDHWVVVDGSGRVDEVSEQIHRTVIDHLGKPPSHVREVASMTARRDSSPEGAR